MSRADNSEKAAMRAAVLRTRAALDPERAATASRLAQAGLLDLPEFAAARIVCCYLAMPGEVETGVVIEACRRAGKTLCVPAWDALRREYGLARLGPSARIVPGRAGVPEPDRPEWAGDEPDFFVVPGVAFDARGGRLGRGGGHYDRLLGGRGPAAAFKAGLAFECQLVDRVPVGAHDVPMDVVVTELGVCRACEVRTVIAAKTRPSGG